MEQLIKNPVKYLEHSKIMQLNHETLSNHQTIMRDEKLTPFSDYTSANSQISIILIISVLKIIFDFSTSVSIRKHPYQVYKSKKYIRLT